MREREKKMEKNRAAAAKRKIRRLLKEAGWPVGTNDGEHIITLVEKSEDDDVEYAVHVQFNLNDLSIEQELEKKE